MHRTLVLDLDGTLVDTVDDLAAALNTIFRPRGLAVADRREVTGWIGNGVPVLLARAFAARQAVLDDAALPEFLDFYTRYAAVLSRPFPGAEGTLASLSARGWRFAVCTNKPEAAARALLDELGLMPWCAAVGGGDSFATRKPDPGHLLATLDAAEGTVGQAIMVGDHANDVHAAAGAGMPCIFAEWGYGPPSMAAGATAVAASFGDLDELCERLLPGAS